MANSYPRRDQASGIWKINQITKNIKDQGTYPQDATGQTALFAGGNPATNIIDQIQISTTANATDFGDLTVTAQSLGMGNASNFTRALFGNRLCQHLILL